MSKYKNESKYIGDILDYQHIVDIADKINESYIKAKIPKMCLPLFFRKPENRHYRACKDQILRNFIHGIQMQYRPDVGEDAEQPNNHNTSEEKSSLWK